MEKKLARRLVIVTQLGTEQINVGVDRVTKIVDNSLEYKNCIFSQYDIYSEEKLIRTIQNCPVDILWY